MSLSAKTSEHPPVLLGADPEFFVRNANGVGQPIYGLIGGTKSQPHPFPIHGRMETGFAYQEDGAAVEFNIPPAPNPERFFYNLSDAMGWINVNLLRPQGLSPTFLPCLDLAPRFLDKPEAHIIGCEGDHYAWDESLMGNDYKRRAFDSKALGVTRFAGFHLHLSYNHKELPQEIAARFMDLYCAIPSLYIDRQGSRRQFYGLAGIYRKKEYGIEYRTLSSRLLSCTADVIGLGYDGTLIHTVQSVARRALQLGGLSYMDLGRLVSLYNKAPWDDVRRAIETEDLPLAANLTEWVKNHDLGR